MFPDSIVLDVDGTIAGPPIDGDYSRCEPILEMVQKMREFKAAGWNIVLYTSRNMRTHQSQLGKINARTLPLLVDWLNRNCIPFDEIHVGKPWPGRRGFYVDDRAFRPDEFLAMSATDDAIDLSKVTAELRGV